MAQRHRRREDGHPRRVNQLQQETPKLNPSDRGRTLGVSREVPRIRAYRLQRESKKSRKATALRRGRKLQAQNLDGAAESDGPGIQTKSLDQIQQHPPITRYHTADRRTVLEKRLVPPRTMRKWSRAGERARQCKAKSRAPRMSRQAHCAGDARENIQSLRFAHRFRQMRAFPPKHRSKGVVLQRGRTQCQNAAGQLWARKIVGREEHYNHNRATGLRLQARRRNKPSTQKAMAHNQGDVVVPKHQAAHPQLQGKTSHQTLVPRLEAGHPNPVKTKAKLLPKRHGSKHKPGGRTLFPRKQKVRSQRKNPSYLFGTSEKPRKTSPEPLYLTNGIPSTARPSTLSGPSWPTRNALSFSVSKTPTEGVSTHRPLCRWYPGDYGQS